jgi:hypothetical protein
MQRSPRVEINRSNQSRESQARTQTSRDAEEAEASEQTYGESARMSKPIYLDYNATTPLSELVKAELVRLLQLDLGNPFIGTEANRDGNL